MNLSERDKLELVSRIGASLWAMFTEEDKARASEFEREMKELYARITADQDKICEIEKSTDGWDQLMVTMLRGSIEVLLREAVASSRERGSLRGSENIMQFMALIFPCFGISDFPFTPGSRRQTAHGTCFAPGSRKLDAPGVKSGLKVLPLFPLAVAFLPETFHAIVCRIGSKRARAVGTFASARVVCPIGRHMSAYEIVPLTSASDSSTFSPPVKAPALCAAAA